MSADNVDIHDRLAIQDLLARYCHSIDASRADLCIGLFTDDAILDTPVGKAEGRAAILEWIEGRLALRAPEYQVGHYMMNTLVTRLSPDSVKVRSMFLYTRQRRDGAACAIGPETASGASRGSRLATAALLTPARAPGTGRSR